MNDNIPTQRFIEDIKEVLGDRFDNFDFSKSIFNGLTKPITYSCRIHDIEYTKEARQLLKGYCCRKCGTQDRKQTLIDRYRPIFFELAPKLHNGYYTYNNVDYQGETVRVMITCPKHGDFPQKPYKHLGNKEKGRDPQGCNICGDERAHDKQRGTTRDFIIDAKKTHDFIVDAKAKHRTYHYNYDSVIYVNCDTPVDIYCNIHNKMFKQTPYTHLSGSGCIDCGIKKRSTQKIEAASNKFWEKANQDEQFDFSKFKYIKNIEKSTIICRKCGEDFQSSPNNYRGRKGCPNCKKKTELKLYKAIIPIYSSTIRELSVDWCRNQETNKHFRFDFCIPKLKIIIELDGIQHIRYVKFFDRKLTFEERHERDEYKQQCANDNEYHMIRILQEDVLYDKNDWLGNLQKEIEYIINNPNVIHNRYICDNDEYKIFK